MVDVDELKIGPQDPERLEPWMVGLQPGDQRLLGRAGVERDHADHRHVGHVREVFLGLDRGVETFAEHRTAEAEQQTEHRSEAEVPERLR